MTAPREIDARQVLDEYVALLRRNRGDGPFPLGELPADKAVIKQILLHVLQLSHDIKGGDVMILAYLDLSKYQDVDSLAREEIAAIDAAVRSKTSMASTDDELFSAAREVVSVNGFVARMQERIEAERSELLVELRRAGLAVDGTNNV